MTPNLVCFLFGMAGNTAIELVKLLGYAQRGRYPSRYKDWRFWVIRLLLVLISGVMALAYSLTGFSYAPLAFHAGVASTLFIEHLSRKLPPFLEQPPST